MADERVSLRIDAKIDNLEVSDKAVKAAQKDLNSKDLTLNISKIAFDKSITAQRKLDKAMKDKAIVLRIDSITFTARAIDKARRKLNQAFKDNGITIDTKVSSKSSGTSKGKISDDEKRAIKNKFNLEKEYRKEEAEDIERTVKNKFQLEKEYRKAEKEEAKEARRLEIEAAKEDAKVYSLKASDDLRARDIESENNKQLYKAIDREAAQLEKAAESFLTAEAKMKAAEDDLLEDMFEDLDKQAEEAAKAYQKEMKAAGKEIKKSNTEVAKEDKQEQSEAAKAEEKRAKDFERNFNKAFKNISSFGKKVFKGFTSIIKSIGKTFLNIFKSVIHTIGSLLKKAFDGVLNIAKSIGLKIKEGFSKGANGLDNFKEKLKEIATLMVGAFSIKGLVDLGKESVELGSDIVEVKNVYEKAFGDLSYIIEDFSERSLKATGLTQLQYQRYSGIFGAMGKSMGLTDKQALKLSTDITKLTGDVASYLNLDYDEAFSKLKAIYSGRMQPLQGIGVQMSSAALGAYALEKGIDKLYSKMSVQERLMVRYAYVLDKLKLANNDFIDTSKSFANQMRLLTGQWKEFLSIVGKALINIITPMIRLLNSLLGILMAFGKKFEEWTIKIFGDANNVSGAAVADLEDTSEDMENALDGVGDSAEENAEKVKNAVMGFDEINKIEKDKSSDSKTDDTGTDNLDDLMKKLGIEDSLNDLMNDRIGILDKFDLKAKEMQETLEELWKWFKMIFNFRKDALKFDDSIEKIKEAWGDIKKYFKENDLGKTITGWAANITGDIVGVGAALGQGLISGFNKFLQDHGDEAISRWDNVVGTINRASDNLANIFKSPQFEGMVSDSYNIANTIKSGFLQSIWTIVEGFTRIAGKEKYLNAFGEAFEWLDGVVSYTCDSINSWLKKVFDYIDTHPEVLVPLEEAVKRLSEAVENLWDTVVKPFLDYLNSDAGVEATANGIVDVLVLVVDGITNLIKFITDLLYVIINWNNEDAELSKSQENLRGVLETVKTVIDTIFRVAKDLFAIVGAYITGDSSKLTDHQKDLKDHLDKVMAVLDTVYKTAGDLFAVIGSYITGDASTLTDHQKDIKDHLDDIIKKAEDLWKNTLEPFFKWLTSEDGLQKVISDLDPLLEVLNSILDVITAITGGFSAMNKIGDIASSNKEIKEAVKSGDVEAEKEARQSVVDKLASFGFKTDKSFKEGGSWSDIRTRTQAEKDADIEMANAIKNEIATNGITNLKESFKKFTLKGDYKKQYREEIPKYATGGYVRPNQPQLAIVGDNRTQGEIISPVDKMAEVFENVLNKYTSQNTQAQPQTIVLNNYTTLDGKVIYSETKQLSYNEANRQGSRQYR